jgi:outer membrane immunogenic protein
MKHLSGVLGFALSSVAAFASANAADIYRAPDAVGGYKDAPYITMNWSGLYTGVNAGYGWNGNNGTLDPTGPLGGAQVGYNFQRGSFVFGAEADFQAARISDNNLVTKSEMDWFGTVRGRAGYAFDRTLVYGTGGFAFGDVINTTAGHTQTHTQTGWVAGGGVEYKVSPAWSVKSEYQFLSLDANDAGGPLGLGTGDRTEVHTVRIGLNYLFGSGYEPLK